MAPNSIILLINLNKQTTNQPNTFIMQNLHHTFLGLGLSIHEVFDCILKFSISSEENSGSPLLTDSSGAIIHQVLIFKGLNQ